MNSLSLDAESGVSVAESEGFCQVIMAMQEDVGLKQHIFADPECTSHLDFFLSSRLCRWALKVYI